MKDIISMLLFVDSYVLQSAKHSENFESLVSSIIQNKIQNIENSTGKIIGEIRTASTM